MKGKLSNTRRLASALLIAALGLLTTGCQCGSSQPPASADPASLRRPQAGDVVGIASRYGAHAWLGIPYAKPPVAELRWMTPETPAKWEGVREAIAHAAACPQLAHPFGVSSVKPGTPVGREDCLYLNLYAPRFDPGRVPAGQKKLPVMVWIHGGGNVVGQAANHDGGNLAVEHGLIVVTINYRLGPLGWFRHPALREELQAGRASDPEPAAASGNFATLDMIEALRWVQRNIGAFGGDEKRVTIFGESAGGRDVFSLLLSPLAKGLFHRAIAQSGATSLQPAEAAEQLAEHGGHRNSSPELLLRLLVADRKAKDREAARKLLAGMDGAAVASYLRQKSAFELVKACEGGHKEGIVRVPNVFADGHVLPRGEALELLGSEEGFNRVPVILGTNRDENKTFMLYDESYVRKFFGLPVRLRDRDRYNATAEALSQLWKADAADLPAAAMRRVQPDVFVYRFDWDEEPSIFGADLSEMLGAGHGLEIPFVFGHFDLGKQAEKLYTDDNRAGRYSLASKMMSYWAEHAYNGKPGKGRKGRLPLWKSWDPSGSRADKFMILDTDAGGGLRMSSRIVSVPEVIQQVDRDSRLRDQHQRCYLFREMARWQHQFSRADYDSAGKNGCRQFPYDSIEMNR